jgi:ribosomal protein S18 acetylase RimI-like enzyme
MITESLPPGFTIRRPTMNDIQETLDLIRTCEVARDGQAEMTLDDIRLWWDMPDFNIATDAWCVFSPEGKMVACSNVDHQEHARLYSNGDVLPEYRRHGIGTHLLRLNEQRAQEHVTQAAPDVRVAILSWVDSKDDATMQLLEKHGFRRIRSSWRMNIQLNTVPPEAVWAEGITLQTLASDPSLFRAVFEADEEAFQDHWGHMPMKFEEWRRWTTERENYDPSLWFLAMDGDQIAGIALCQDDKENGAWVHSLGIRRPWRRKGIGLALLHHAFGEFYRRGLYDVYLGVDAQSLTGATRLYERAGMHIVRQAYTYEKELRAGKELSTQSVDL